MEGDGAVARCAGVGAVEFSLGGGGVGVGGRTRKRSMGEEKSKLYGCDGRLGDEHL